MNKKIKYYGKKLANYPIIGAVIIKSWELYKNKFLQQELEKPISFQSNQANHPKELIRFCDNIKISLPVTLREIYKELDALKKRVDELEAERKK